MTYSCEDIKKSELEGEVQLQLSHFLTGQLLCKIGHEGQIVKVAEVVEHILGKV